MSRQATKKESEIPLTGLTAKIKRLERAILRNKKVFIPAAFAVVLAFSLMFHVGNFSSASYALTSKCTISILSGTAEIIIPGSSNAVPGKDGMTLDAGDRVKTSPDSTALLTFFDGSTLALEPGTDIEIEQLEYGNSQHTITIVLKQWTGKTWSHVVKMADRGSHYEIKTPSAVALVRGTQFFTEVDELGATKVLTAEGLVSVSAQGEEIFLPKGQQTEVEPGTAPSEPKQVDISEYIESQKKVQNENTLSNLRLSTNSLNSIPVDNGSDGSDFDGMPTEETAQNNLDAKANPRNAGDDNDLSNNAGSNQPQAMGASLSKATDQGNKNDIGNDQSTTSSQSKSGSQAANDNIKDKDDDQEQNNCGTGDQDQCNTDSNSNDAEPSNNNGQANGNAGDQSSGNGQANGNANGQSESNSQDNSSGQANGNAGDQSSGNGQANGNANGQSESNSQDNSSGQANGNAGDQSSGNGQANGNANGQSESNSQDNSSGQANGNAGDQSSGNGQANGNAGDQSSGNGQANGNANGQGNGNDETPAPTTVPPGKSDKSK